PATNANSSDADRSAIAIIPMPSRQEVWRVYSTGYEEWLRSTFWRTKEAGVADTSMKAALATLAAAGINDGEEVEIHVRAAQDESGYLIDLCDDRWRAVRIAPTAGKCSITPGVFHPHPIDARLAGTRTWR
ncbi:MAG: hypothetical protein IPP41_15240, partial [Rhodocyclaceae bacterium]|nr:hypothetical protein [Rhodocyclaceae bacterium]